MNGNVLHYTRQYTMNVFSVPVAKIPDLNRAFAKIAADERASVIFVEK